MRFIVLAALAFIATVPAEAAPYRSLTRDFVRFYDATRNMPDAERVKLFRQRFNKLLPGFYEPADGQSEAGFDANVIEAFADFPAIRARYEAVERSFPQAYATGLAHFRKQFPGFTPTLSIWLIHSLGRMDGGTRTLRGRNVMLFGADVIAKIHDAKDIGPFLDHEMFHVENGRWFKDCDQLWCSLWQEGAAVYAASVMNPGTDDHTLMLDQPRPIRAAVDAHWRQALCRISADFDSTAQPTYARYFFGRSDETQFPPRWGYYVGYRLVARLGLHRTLAELDHLDNAAARPLVRHELDTMIAEAGGCPG